MARSFLTAATDRVQADAYSALQGLTTLTLALWAYRTGSGDATASLMRSESAGGSSGFQWRDNDADTTLRFLAQRWATTSGHWSWPRPSSDAWHALALTYDYGDVANDPALWVDGAEQEAPTEVATPAGTPLSADAFPLAIGNSANPSNRNWSGSLAHAAIWSRILDAAELAALGHGASPLFFLRGLVGYWPLTGNASPEPNAVAGSAGAVTGTEKSDSPPVFWPEHAALPPGMEVRDSGLVVARYPHPLIYAS